LKVFSYDSQSMTVLGTDLSPWQGKPDFDKLAAAGIKFAISKATDGLNVANTFASDWANSKGKVTRGAYTWFHPDVDWKQQADKFIATVGTLEDDDLPLAIDFEQATTIVGAPLLKLITDYTRYLAEQTGRKPILYTGKYYWMQYVKDLDAPDLIEICDLWHAEYPNASAHGTQYEQALAALKSPHPAKPWASRNIAPKLWQFDGDKGLTLPDGTDADFNRFDGSDEEFAAWIASTILPPYC
jgi:GH25 family lysozyme M1 (1,4-beta-N-acetylmuramidase)